MTRCLQAVRFVTGLAMLVGGVAVLAPLAADLLAQQSPISSDVAGDACRTLPPVAIGHAIPDSRAVDQLSSPLEPSRHAVSSGGALNAPPQAAAVYQPPAAPPPLPPDPTMMTQPAPPLGATYRSTLSVPPPHLLDAHGPPPLAPGWTNRDAREPLREGAASTAAVPATYAVRDGDDLTSLAVHFYGHPAAAGAIFAANRDRLATSDILPIGVRLRLPPPWAVTAGRTAAESRAIEPGPGFHRGPAVTPARLPRGTTPAGQAWLNRAPASNASGGISD